MQGKQNADLKKSGMVLYPFNPTNRKAEAGISLFEANLVYRTSSRLCKVRPSLKNTKPG